jgi:plastocyanin
MRFGLALVLGMLAALLVAGLPASAADQSIDAVANTGWNPNNVSIAVGETVTWKNATGYSHNVCVRRSNVSSGCGEYRNANPSDTWPAEGWSHAFTSDGTFTFMCQLHPAMTGTITVGTGDNPPVDTGTGTGTSTTPPAASQPTDTITNPTQTEQTTAAPDTTKPSFGTVKRRAGRKALTVEVGASEEATLRASVFRRRPGARTFTRVSQSSRHVKAGKNVVTLIRALRRKGAYRVKLQLEDAAANKSATKTLNFKLA